MTHKDIYTKFMIEYDKANVTSSYPSLTEFEVATVLDKAYNALIAQKVTGNNVRRVSLEGDLKNISDISPLIKLDNNNSLTAVNDTNIVYCDVPKEMLYFVSGYLKLNKTDTLDRKSPRPLPLKLVNHEIADKFIISAYNMPWIKTPVCYIEDDKLYIVYDSINTPLVNNVSLTFIKKPNTFVKDLNKILADHSGYTNASYFNYTKPNNSSDDLPEYKFECNNTVAEELISLAVAFALENIESLRLNSKLNMRGLEA